MRLGEQFPTFRKMVVYFRGQAVKEECIFLAKFYCAYINGEMGRTCSTCIWKKKINTFSPTRKTSCQHSDVNGVHEELCYKF